MLRLFNFSPGPATLPTEVLLQAQNDLLDYQGRGMSIMEMSHRGEVFMALAAEAEANLRQLLVVPPHYKILFLQGGAFGQFAAVPFNLLGHGGVANYLLSGHWSQKALDEAKRIGQTHIAASTEKLHFSRTPKNEEIKLSAKPAYLHYTDNETIGGLVYPLVPEPAQWDASIPIVTDMSSSLLSRPIDVLRFGVIYAAAQKNIGPAGLTIVIIADNLLDRALSNTPSVFHYQQMAATNSMLNTPPTFAWYMSNLMFKWLIKQGGLADIEKQNQQKAQILYDVIDQYDFYCNLIEPQCRSIMNVVFKLADEKLTTLFVEQAAAQGLFGLKGHRVVGGIRASIYNALPEQAIVQLADFMQDFVRRYG